MQSSGLAAVDAERVFPLHGDDARREPALVHRRLPCGGVMGALAAGAAAVHRRRGEGKVERVGREAAPFGGAGGAQAASCASESATTCSMSVSRVLR